MLARGSRQLEVALAASAGGGSSRGRSAGGAHRVSAKGVLALVLVVLALIGVVVTLRRLLRRRPSKAGGQQASGPAPTLAPTPPTSPASTAASRGPATGTRPRDGQAAPPRGNGQRASGGGIGATRLTLRDTCSSGVAVDRRDVVHLLRYVRFTKHAIEQFATRAGVPLTSYGHAELLIREVLRREGKVATERPFWSRSSNTADLYLQAGEWMLFILLRDRWLPWR